MRVLLTAIAAMGLVAALGLVRPGSLPEPRLASAPSGTPAYQLKVMSTPAVVQVPTREAAYEPLSSESIGGCPLSVGPRDPSVGRSRVLSLAAVSLIELARLNPCLPIVRDAVTSAASGHFAVRTYDDGSYEVYTVDVASTEDPGPYGDFPCDECDP